MLQVLFLFAGLCPAVSGTLRVFGLQFSAVLNSTFLIGWAGPSQTCSHYCLVRFNLCLRSFQSAHWITVTVNIGLGYLITDSPKGAKRAIALYTLVTVILRAEVILLLGPLVLQALWTGRASFTSILVTGITVGFISLGILYP